MPITCGESILNGKYCIIKLIGEGGMACVWLAEELTFGNRLVAIKQPLPCLLPGNQEDIKFRYQNEVYLCAALEKSHVPHVVRALTAEPYESSLLLVLEYMPGGDLVHLLRTYPNGLPLQRALDITRDVLAALSGVHTLSLGIVHRDIKPSNILFDLKGLSYLGDFGVAQIAGMSHRSHLQGGSHPGTPFYMAPEQGSNVTYLTPSADIYALGCVLFEMLTGKIYKNNRPGTPPSKLNPALPKMLDEVLAKALAEDPFNRYQSANEMAEALQLGENQVAEGLVRQQEEESRIIRERQEAEEKARLVAAEAAKRQREEIEKARLERERRASLEAARQSVERAAADERRRQRDGEMHTPPIKISTAPSPGLPHNISRRKFLIAGGLVAASGLLGYFGWRAIDGSGGRTEPIPTSIPVRSIATLSPSPTVTVASLTQG